jgi:uncharacterized membrane protein (DUF485 family)
MQHKFSEHAGPPDRAKLGRVFLHYHLARSGTEWAVLRQQADQPRAEDDVQQIRPGQGVGAIAQVRAHPCYAPLVRKRRRLAWALTLAMLVVYFGFIALVAFAPGIMAQPVSRTITLGFPLGLGVILAAIALTGVYVWRANAEFDGLTQRIVEDAP